MAIEASSTETSETMFGQLVAGQRLLSKSGNCELEVVSVEGDELLTIILKGGDGLRGLEGSRYRMHRNNFHDYSVAEPEEAPLIKWPKTSKAR
jgi:hypothetical protein